MEEPQAQGLEMMSNPASCATDDHSAVHDARTAHEMAVEWRKDGGLPVTKFERWMGDARNQPPWRALADKCADYYDNNQLTNDQIAEMEADGRAPIISNITRPVIDVVLGMEAKTRQDWRSVADAGEFQDVAEAESFLMAEDERLSGADRACSDAYAAQIKTGMGWVEVFRTLDPFAPSRYKARYVHRREIWWDWRSKEPDLSDARWLRRQRWVDLDEAIAHFPDKRDLLEFTGRAQGFDRFDLSSESPYEALADAHQIETRTTLDDIEWRDTEREQVCLTEFWYRTWHRGHVFVIGNNIIPLDKQNPAHVAAVMSGKAEVRQAVYTKLRLSWWVGPHRLADIETKERDFPYIPFWGFREDRTGAPYGLIRPMLDPQDEYNARRQKLMWLLSSKRMFIDSDALDKNYNDIRDVAEEIGRPDAVVVLDPKRKQGSGVKVETDHNLATQQFQVMKDAQELLQSTAGVYQSMMGQSGSASSGLAINSLVEQGATTLAEINDNYRYSRRKVGERLRNLRREDIGSNRFLVEVGEGSSARTIVLNDVQPDGRVLNDMLRAKTKVALADVPSTPSYRAQQLSMLGELTKSLPPQIQGLVIDFVLEATDLPQRREMAERIRKSLNITDPKQMTPEQEQQAQEMMAAEQQKKAQADELALRGAAAEVAVKEATAAEKEASAQEKAAKAQQVAEENDRIKKLEQQLEAAIEHVGMLTQAVEQLAVRQ